MTTDCAIFLIVKETRIKTKTPVYDCIKTDGVDWQRSKKAPRISRTAAGPTANISLFRNGVHIFPIFFEFLNFLASHCY
jgi:hypothetical protein